MVASECACLPSGVFVICSRNCDLLTVELIERFEDCLALRRQTRHLDDISFLALPLFRLARFVQSPLPGLRRMTDVVGEALRSAQRLPALGIVAEEAGLSAQDPKLLRPLRTA